MYKCNIVNEYQHGCDLTIGTSIAGNHNRADNHTNSITVSVLLLLGKSLWS